MRDNILTDGLEADRYLKARQLAHDFEIELIDTLETVGRDMLRDAGYHTDVSFREKALGPERTATLATIRVESPLRHDDITDTNAKLNVGVEWVTPDTIDEAPDDGNAYVYAQYKLQHGSQAVYDEVREATTESDAWSTVRFYADQWYSPQKHAPGIVAIPLSASSTLQEHLYTLHDHFTTVYAPNHREYSLSNTD